MSLTEERFGCRKARSAVDTASTKAQSATNKVSEQAQHLNSHGVPEQDSAAQRAARQARGTLEDAVHPSHDSSESAAGRTAREAREVIEDSYYSAKDRVRETKDNAKEWVRSKTGECYHGLPRAIRVMLLVTFRHTPCLHPYVLNQGRLPSLMEHLVRY